MGFSCCRCGYTNGDRSYIPIDPKGSGRRWVCTKCASEKEINDTKANLGEDALKVAQDINPEFLK